ncbi:hypothetical protein C7A17_16870 [Ectopseudomonas mendocina]|uniref:Arc-like DNA binding domain-containing protein n=1 Tax=Ectopseudomonas mendocina TaxID=300 RepID=A0A2R3QRG5_ECTME|nr:hypothetical protein C7A17_16870 [Pseudomonas mendocina]
MTREHPQFKLRMPPALRAQVKQAAEQANRSLNAEIVTRLQASFTQAKPEVSANDQHEPVPAIAPQGLRLPELLCAQSTGQDVRLSPAPARRQLRLLCVLVEPQLGAGTPRYLPFHTMHRVPPRAMVKGKWSQPRYAGLYLRETHATVPTGEVLERCERHRQTHAFRAPARTVRTGGVIA